MKKLLLSALMALGVNSCSPAMAEEPVPDCITLEAFSASLAGKTFVPVWKGQSVQDGYVLVVWRVNNAWIITATDPKTQDVCFVDRGINNEILVGAF